MDKFLRNTLIVLALLVILTPLGLISTGETFGEWGTDELKEKIGYVPSGLESLSSLWGAPMSDYGFPGNDTTVGMIVGYIVSAIIGVILAGGALYVLGKATIKNDG